ncbi:phage major capsid protein [Motilimonas cestriensis]|uniref:Phage major capsid protein n=1 Tax=Motilimonas cestriensis TaxID=2742685 RepID=A0ABS8WG89_9GAMM|nr:phage major capsid protein [Motilimonas cestriensis]MCE2597207.1 phage major capsid protein [Motilimonas cestriensis]
MPIEQKDIELVAEELGHKFTEFTKKNDKRIDAIEQEKSKLSERVDTLNGTVDSLQKQKEQLEEQLKKSQRPSGGKGQTPEAAEHKKAFERFIKTGRGEDELRDLESKALATDTPEDGGLAVPLQLDQNIIQLLNDANVMRQECTVVPTGGVGYKQLVNKGGATSGWVGETDARPETSTPKLGELSPHFGELYANPSATQNMLDDSFFDVESWLSGEVQTEFSEEEEIAFTVGDGANKPKGLFAYASSLARDKDRAFGTLQHLVSGSAGSFNGDNLTALLYSLRKVYRRDAKWMLNNDVLFKARLLKDNDGNYLWRPGLELGQPSSLLGYGVAENEALPDAVADAKAIAFGNFKRAYKIIDVIGTRVLRDPYTRKPYVQFYTTKRVGGMLTDSSAVKILQLSA